MILSWIFILVQFYTAGVERFIMDNDKSESFLQGIEMHSSLCG
jgi:hypothetical protein